MSTPNEPNEPKRDDEDESEARSATWGFGIVLGFAWLFFELVFRARSCA